MESEQSRESIIKRILGRLPQHKQEDNVAALKAVLGDSTDIQQMSFDFEVISGSQGEQFIATPYTAGESHENLHR